jgi:hypothetical protein
MLASLPAVTAMGYRIVLEQGVVKSDTARP